MSRRKLPRSFYTRTDTLRLARELIGKVLVTRLNGETTSGMIVETEAYQGPHDCASHSFGGRRTPRTEPMFWRGGFAYVYLCYGIHHLFNVVVNEEDVPHAILIRAIEPINGIDLMLERRKKKTIAPPLTSGPGALSEALGITTALDRSDLTHEPIWMEDRGIVLSKQQIVTGPRVGVSYAGRSARWPWRFRLKNSLWTSKPR